MKTCELPPICLIVLVILAGCDTRGSTSDAAFDAFKSFSERLNTELSATLSGAKPVSFDVQKTDSLVSPFTAHITFSFSMPIERDEYHCLSTQNVRADYAYQQGRWICKQVLMKGEDLQFVSGNQYRFQLVKDQWVGSTVGEVKGAEILSSENELVKLVRDCNR